MQQQLLLVTPSNFDPNNYCIKPQGRWGNCLACHTFQKGECCPCNSCPKREGYWTPSGKDDGKNIEVKCHAPCRLVKHWVAWVKENKGLDFSV